MSLEQLANRLIAGDAGAVERLTREALEAKLTPRSILEGGLIAGMAVVGERFKNHEMFFPEVLIAARAMKAGMSLLEPLLKESGVQPLGRCLLGTVKGDIHDIGKNLVAILLKGSGFEVIDLGVNVTLEKFVAAVETHHPDILGMSALLTTTMVQMKINIDGLRKAGLLNGMRVMVGGAPVTQGYAVDIGAHAYGQNATDAAQKAAALLGELKGPASNH